MKLYFLRHAKSSWDDLHLDDFKRPLSERGLKNSEMLNAFLKSKKISFDKVYSSSSVRTEITCSVGLEGIYDFEKVTFLDDLVDEVESRMLTFLYFRILFERILGMSFFFISLLPLALDLGLDFDLVLGYLFGYSSVVTFLSLVLS